MADGVIPSAEFNEQLKRTVRESIRRDRSSGQRQGRWQKRGGGGGIRSEIVRGIITAADCAAGTIDVQTVAYSGGCSNPSDQYDGVISDVADPYTLMDGYTAVELVDAIVRIEYMYPVDYCSDGEWELTMIGGDIQCEV